MIARSHHPAPRHARRRRPARIGIPAAITLGCALTIGVAVAYWSAGSAPAGGRRMIARSHHPAPRHARRRRPARIGIPAAIALVFVLTVGVAVAYWSAGSAPGGHGASGATTVNQGATPVASAAANAITITWDASTLSNGDPVDGYLVKRYDLAAQSQTVLSACTGTITALTCVETGVPTGSWVYSVTPVVGTSWQGAESATSNTVTTGPTDPTPPANVITMQILTGTGAKTGTTIHYRGTVAGSFTLTNAVTDADSGPASSATAALGGTTTGWTHTPSTVSTPAGGPYLSATFGWGAGTTSSPTEVVTGRDVAGNTVTTTLTFVDDSTAPTAGTVSYTDGYQPSRSVAVTFTTGTDTGGSGLGTRQLQRQSAPLTTAGTCVTWSGYTNIGPVNPTSIYTDSSVANGTCYQYRYIVTDLAGNSHTATSGNVSKVDYSGAVASTTGLYSYWRMGDAVGSTVMDDITATNNNGTYFNAPTRGVAGAPSGDANTAVQFNGTTQYAHALRQLSGNFSFDFWVRSTQSYANNAACTQWSMGAALIDTNVAGQGDDFGISMCLGKIIAGTGSPDVSVVSAATYNDGSWHHVAFTRTQSSGAMALYVDGSSVGTATGSTAALDSAANLSFARSHSSQYYFAGALDEIALYNTALSGGTVANHYSFGSAGSAPTSAPTAVADSYSVNEDTTLNVAAAGVLTNDTDPDGNPLTAVLVTGTTGLTLNANGSFAYVPPANFSGGASFTYKANDGALDSNTVTVNITVNAANETPSFTKGANQSVGVSAGAQSVIGWATAISQGTGESGQVVDFIVTNDNNGLFTVQPAISATGTLTYTPGASAGVATVSVSIHDNGGTANGGVATSAVQTFTITVTTASSLGIFTANQDVGGPSIAGSSSYSAGTYTMSGSGADIWGNPDQFQYLHVPMTGDGRLTARVVTDTNPHAAAKAGVMMRSTLTGGSVHALMGVTASNGTEFIARTVDSQTPYASGTSGLLTPYWVRLTRVGNTFKAERSPDGITWTQQGTTQTITMGSTIYVGLVVSSHTNAALHTATFDNVALTSP